MEKHSDSDWQNSWGRFIGVLTEQLRKGATSEELAQQFGSKSVTWSGVLSEKRLDSLAPMVTIDLPIPRIDLGELGVVNVGEQSVPTARDAVVQWNDIPIGTAVSFTGTLDAGSSPFPPVEVIRLSSGRTLVMMRLSNGRPCRWPLH